MNYNHFPLKLQMNHSQSNNSQISSNIIIVNKIQVNLHQSPLLSKKSILTFIVVGGCFIYWLYRKVPLNTFKAFKDSIKSFQLWKTLFLLAGKGSTLVSKRNSFRYPVLPRKVFTSTFCHFSFIFKRTGLKIYL